MGRKRDEDKWKAVQVSLEASPGDSDRTIAYCNDCSPTFVGKVRMAMVAEGKLQSVAVREGLDGRTRGRTDEEKERLRKEKQERLRKENERIRKEHGETRGRPRQGILRKRDMRINRKKEYYEQLKMVREEAKDPEGYIPEFDALAHTAHLDVDNFDLNSQGKRRGKPGTRKKKDDDE